MNRLVILGLLLASAGLQSPARAQDIWRCGADGRTFSDRPCTDGRPLQMAVLVDTRTAGEVQAAHEVAARERRLADSLQQERMERELQAWLSNRPHVVAHGRHDAAELRPDRETAKPRSKSQPQSKGRSPAGDGTWRAVVPASRRTKD